MKARCKPMILVALCLLLGCSSMQSTFSKELYAYCSRPIPVETQRIEIPYAKMYFSDPDLKTLLLRADALQSRIETEEDAKALQAELDSLYEAFIHAETMGTLAYLHYCENVTDKSAKGLYEMLSADLDRLSEKLTDLSLQLAKEPALRNRYDKKTVARLETEALLYDESAQELFLQEQELVGRYEAMQAEFTIERDGKQWTMDALINDETLSFAEWYDLYQSYCCAYAQEAGELFRTLITVRNGIARQLGFSSYPAYRYAVYARDYRPEEAQTFSERARDGFSDLFRTLYQSAASDREILYLSDRYPESETMERVGTVVHTILPELSAPWDYLLRNRLYDVSTGELRMPGSFTTYLPEYGAPFLFSSWDDSASMPTVMLHEFGHFAGYYFRTGREDVSGGALDLAETDSQGLELLAMPYYETLFGRRAEEARMVRICDALYAILSGCAMDAFEQYAYENETESIEALNAYFEQLCKAYGLEEAGFTASTWTEIGHLYRAPCYYISYATGAVAALELYQSAMTSPKRAAQQYRGILLRNGGGTFRDTLRKNGLTDPMEDDTITVLSELLSTNFVEDKG